MSSLQHEWSPHDGLIDADRIDADRIGVDRHLGVGQALVDLFPERALVRGQIITYAGDAARSLALASVAQATADGSWLALVAVGDLGVEAAVEFGVDLTRMIVVDARCGDHRRWVDVVGAAADGCEVIIAAAPPQLSDRALRWLRQRLRSRGAALLVLADHGRPARDRPARDRSASDRSASDRYGADLGFDVRTSQWVGIERGAGVLRARRVEVSVAGRRIHRVRTATYWLPGPDGVIEPADPVVVAAELDGSSAIASGVS